MKRKFTNPTVIFHTMPVYEYRSKTTFEQWLERRRSERNTDELLGYKNCTMLIIVLAGLAIILGAIVAGLFIVG